MMNTLYQSILNISPKSPLKECPRLGVPASSQGLESVWSRERERERERERRHAALPARSRAAAAAEPQQGPPYILVSTHKYFGTIEEDQLLLSHTAITLCWLVVFIYTIHISEC